jgi:hypothetical protein
LLSMSLSPEGMVPSENSRLPDPLTRGEDPQAVLVDKIVAQQRQHATPKTQKRMSSIFTPYWAMAPRSCASGDCSRGKLSATVGGTWESARIYESRHTTKKVGVLGRSPAEASGSGNSVSALGGQRPQYVGVEHRPFVEPIALFRGIRYKGLVGPSALRGPRNCASLHRAAGDRASNARPEDPSE